MSTDPAKIAEIGRDRAALRHFYRDHVDAVQRFVARRVDDPHLVADLVADVFVAAIGSADSYRATGAGPRAWLYGVARNVVATEQRRRVVEGRAVRRVGGRRLLDSEDVARLEERIDAERRSRELYQAMDTLPNGQRALLELVALDGLTVTDAAQALGINSVTARVRLHRARTSMRDLLAPSPTLHTNLTEVTP